MLSCLLSYKFFEIPDALTQASNLWTYCDQLRGIFLRPCHLVVTTFMWTWRMASKAESLWRESFFALFVFLQVHQGHQCVSVRPWKNLRKKLFEAYLTCRQAFRQQLVFSFKVTSHTFLHPLFVVTWQMLLGIWIKQAFLQVDRKYNRCNWCTCCPVFLHSTWSFACWWICKWASRTICFSYESNSFLSCLPFYNSQPMLPGLCRLSVWGVHINAHALTV